METVKELLLNTWYVLNILCFLFMAVYAIKRGWEEGKMAVTIKKKVCDVCWRDIEKVNEKLKS